MDAAVASLRQARRRNRLADVDRFETFYRAYVVVLLSAVAVGVVADQVGGVEVGPAAVADVVRQGPALLGLLVAVALLLGARSGARGGPLGIEQADVRHLLLSPTSRRAVVQPLVLRQLSSAVTGGVAVGAVAGMLASRRLPGATSAWVATGGLFGALVLAVATGSALVMSGARVRRWQATAVGLALMAPSAWDVWSGSGTAWSPLTLVGRATLAPIVGPDAVGRAVGIAVASVLVGLGIALAPRLSLEAAEQRSKLVGEMRFAATLQDVRTVLVLQRQLSQDRPRRRPWVRLPRRGRFRFPTWRRDWHGLLRWRGTRYLRVAVLGAVAGGAIIPARTGTPAMLAVTAVALWLAALDVAEPIAQELDHPALLDSAPATTGTVLVRHLPAFVVAMAVPVAIAVAIAGDMADEGVAVTAVAVAQAVVGSVVGAVMTLVKGPPPPFDPVDLMVGPEAAAARKVQRLLFPVAVAGVGATTMWEPSELNATMGLVFTLLAGGLLLTWLAFLNKSMSRA